mmetsp:Transcript_32050/g.61959  ORF Transcript_32050/g.61959 Transcript_32050/m.61959 type:complete len:112 (-) Transcript_32050:80-415(-)
MQSQKYLTDVAQALDPEQFLGQFKIKSLSDEDLKDMWRRYDKDDSGDMSMAELRTFLEDLLEKEKGHRNLDDEVFKVCQEAVDTNKDGVISFEEFEKYLGDYTLLASSAKL